MMGKPRCVVIGAGQGGLSAAIHASLKGYAVTVLERSDTAGGKAAQLSIDGFKLDPGPSIIILPELYEQTFRAANRDMGDFLSFRRLDPFSRVYLEGSEPIDLPSDPSACEAMVRQLAPGDGDAFASLMKKLKKIAPLVRDTIFDHEISKPWQLLDPRLIQTALPFNLKKSYKELVDGMFSSPLLRAFFYGFPSYGGQTYDSKAAGALLIPYYMIEGGVYYPEGGVGAIPMAFERLARELGVTFRFEAKVSSFETMGARVSAVKLENGEVIEADVVISGVDYLATRSWLGYRVDWEPSLSYFTVHWGVEKKLPSLDHHTLFIPNGFDAGFEQLYRQSEFPGKPIVYVNATASVDEQSAPEGCENVFAVITSPAQTGSWDWDSRALEYRDVVRATLRRFGVDWTEDEQVFERIQTPSYFETAHGNYKGSLYGPHERHRKWGILPHGNRDPDFRNVYYCGGSVQPGAGLPMVTLSGKFAAHALPKA